MNIEKLQEIRDHILTVGRVDMDVWRDQYRKKTDDEWCGTTGCIAGWAMTLDSRVTFKSKGSSVIKKCEVPGLSHDTVEGQDHEAVGAAILGLHWTEAERLFYTYNWPRDLRERYDNAPAQGCERPHIVAERIDRFIASKGMQ